MSSSCISVRMSGSSAEKASSINRISGLIAGRELNRRAGACRRRVHPARRGHNSPAPPDAAPPGFCSRSAAGTPASAMPNAVLSSTLMCGISARTEKPSQFSCDAPRAARHPTFWRYRPVNQHLAAGGFNQAIEKANHGGFPRAGEPHDDEYLAFFNGQTGVFDAKRQPRFSSICALLSPFSIYLKARCGCSPNIL